MKTALITGASGGIGEALATKLAGRKYNLLLVARNAERLEKECSQLADSFGIDAQYIAADLSKPGAAEEIFAETVRRGLEIDMLINNAGIGSGGQFSELPLQSELELLQLNISSLVALTHLFLPRMQQRRSGTIINVASMAGFMPIPYMATYAASKMFVRSFTEAITEECKPYNIHVMLLIPGLTRTNFNKAAGIENRAESSYDNSTQTPGQVAEEAMKALNKGKHVIVSGKRNRLMSKLTALVPDSWITKRYAKAHQKNTKI